MEFRLKKEIKLFKSKAERIVEKDYSDFKRIISDLFKEEKYDLILEIKKNLDERHEKVEKFCHEDLVINMFLSEIKFQILTYKANLHLKKFDDLMPQENNSDLT